MSLAESIRDELVKVFTEPQAEVLSHCVVRAHDTLATRSDMHDLRVAITELTGAQKNTESKVAELTEAQGKTESKLTELADAQGKTESRLTELADAQGKTESRLTELADAQGKTESKLAELADAQGKTESKLAELVDAQGKTESKLAELVDAQGKTESKLAELADAQGKTESKLAELADAQKEVAHAQKETSATVADLAHTVRTLGFRTDQTSGWALEWLVGKHLPAYLGRRIRRCKVIGIMDVIEPFEDRLLRRDVLSGAGIPMTEEAAAGELSAEEIEDLRRVDLIATGRVATGRIVSGEVETTQLYLVGEVSFRADDDDVLRAGRRAALLRKAGFEAQAFVACDVVHEHVVALARREEVWIIVKGRLLSPAA
jgi:hypothetical protein